MPNTETLPEAINAIPEARLAEIEDIAAFIASREQDRALVRAGMESSAPAFATVWQNPDDDIYDRLRS